ncbi:dihydrolipoyl dehydrogenase [Halomonas cerina]|uniref:Dihydrolipoamide dehydrogenase n=1 Tax=Halomonas cerina TaxID=447424 RepID=A0A839V8N7_9GAMM|nr:dihydrolipoyl dehydrogenase [Halomonas cerina]MBB3190350.1 dihydrolipoamide dehydrogenase [Halomonas cerina]
MMRHAKLVILGAGTAGLTALKEAQRYTDDVLLINAGPYGTTCARVGCMPSKALLEVAHAYGRRDWLAASGMQGGDTLRMDLSAVMAHVRALRDRFVAGPIGTADALGERSLQGQPRFIDPTTLEVNGERIRAEAVIIATGTRPIVPDAWQSLGERIVTSDDVFELQSPGRRLGVVGLGPIGVELGQAFAQLGCEVHGFTRGPRVAGLSDPEVNASLLEALRRQMTVTTEAEVTLHRSDKGVVMQGGGQEVEVDWVLASLGRRPNVEGLGLENLGVELDGRGVPRFDAATLRIGDLPVFMAGDVDGLRPLMHEAADAGRIAAYHALHPDAECLARRTPQGIVFTEPGAGHAGLTRAELPESGVVTGSADFTQQARALMAGRNAGRLQLYADESDGRLLGAELVAPDAEHLLHLLAWSIQQNLNVDQLLEMTFYHPTVEEGVRGALQAVRHELGKRRTQPDLPLCHEPADWALG